MTLHLEVADLPEMLRSQLRVDCWELLPSSKARESTSEWKYQQKKGKTVASEKTKQRQKICTNHSRWIRHAERKDCWSQVNGLRVFDLRDASKAGFEFILRELLWSKPTGVGGTLVGPHRLHSGLQRLHSAQIGRASCRERVYVLV